MRIKYNAPTVLTYTLVSVTVLLLSQTIAPHLTSTWFMVPGRDDFNPHLLSDWVCLVTHVIGHANWNHLISNFSYILLIGPMLEENYGSFSLLFMIVITALVTGVLNILLFSTDLLGASGVVFMMILLGSFTNNKKDEIPITFLLILILYLGREVLAAFKADSIAEFAHIVGGFCGSLFGFFRTERSSRSRGI